jgi:broad specificity phosphatase PhoE
MQTRTEYDLEAIEAFRAHCHQLDTRTDANQPNIGETVVAFLDRFRPVLRHYRAEIVGQCLATAVDTPTASSRGTVGFGVLMAAGNHREDRESQLGSYRDDGCYLAILANDWFIDGVRR